jgi:hypothetical protein
MADITTLGIAVDTREVNSAEKDLDNLAKTSGKAEKATDDFTESSKKSEKQSKETGGAIGALSKEIGNLGSMAGIAAAAVGAAMVAIGVKSVALASDLEETQGKFNVVFRGMEEDAESWAKTLQESYGTSELEGKRYLSAIQDLAVPTGLAREEAGKLSNQFVKMAVDLGSFNNLPTQQVIEDIQSALQGSTETMAKYGINVKVAKLQQEALNLGLADSKNDISDADKAIALYSIAMREGSDAMGDFQRTGDSLANQQKVLSAEFQDIMSTIGKELMPVVTEIVTDFNKWLKANDDLVAKDIAGFVQKTAKAIEFVSDALQDAGMFTNWLVGEILLGWDRVEEATEILKVFIVSGFEETFDGVTDSLAYFVGNAAAIASAIPGQSEYADSLFDTASQLRNASHGAGDFSAEVSKLQEAHEKTRQAIRDTQEEVYLEAEAQRASIAATETVIKTKQDQQKALDGLVKKHREVNDGIVESETAKNQKIIDLNDDLTERLEELTLSEFEFRQKEIDREMDLLEGKADGEKELLDKIDKLRKAAFEEALLDQEEFVDKSLSGLEEYAEEDIQLREEVARFKMQLMEAETKAEQDELLKQIKQKEDAYKKKKKQDEDYQEIYKDFIGAGVDAWIQGEDAKVAVSEIATQYLTDYAVEQATKGLPMVLEGLGSMIGAWVGLGMAETQTEGKTWQEKLATGAAYLGSAAAGVLGGKAVGEMFAEGGIIQGGSGIKDDVFMGYSADHSGTYANWAMGGEYIVNKKSTQKHKDTLEKINNDTFADGGQINGGPVADEQRIWQAAENINAGGFDTFWTEFIKTRNWKQAAMQAALFYGGTFGGMALGKAVGKDLFSGGGEVRDKGYLFGGFLDDLLDPLGINDDVMKIAGFDPLKELLGIDTPSGFGDIYKDMSTWPAFQAANEIVRNAIIPIVRDTVTPGKDINPGTFEDMFTGAIETALKKSVEFDPGLIFDPGGVTGIFSADGGQVPGYAMGGTVDKLIAPGDDGIASLKMGEEVLNRNLSKRLDKFLASGGGHTTVNVYIGQQKLNQAIENVIIQRNKANVGSNQRVYA